VRKLGVVVLVLAAVVLGYGLRGCLSPAGPAEPAAVSPEAEKGPAEEEAKAEAQWWICSMHPQIRQPKPGRCPICAMELIAVVQEASAGGGGLRRLTVSPEAEALMDIQTTPVERRLVAAEVRMVGKVEYDETKLAYITAWVPGRIDRLYVDYTGIEVKKDDHLVYLYSPELLSAQEELLQAIKAVKEVERSELTIMREMTAATVEASRGRLRLWGITEEQIREIETRGTPSDHMTIYAPMGGIVIHKNAQEGMYVQTGTRIYTIADLSSVWVKLDAYESDLAWLRYGQQVTFSTEAYAGETFAGRIVFIDPTLNEKTRTVKVRVNVPNPDRELKPGMFVRAVVRSKVALGGRVMDPDLAGKWICYMHPEVVSEGPGDCRLCGMPLVRTEELGYVSVAEAEVSKPLVIPVTAALVTGTRAIVYVQVPGTDAPTYEGRQVVLGPRAGDHYIVRHGLREGELVITNGNFKIDSALQIQAKPSMMTPEGGGGAGMHHHGEASAPKGAAPEMSSTAMVPAKVLDQLRRIDGAAGAVSDAMEASDLAGAKEAYETLGEAVDQVDGNDLSGHPRMLWQELAMLLGNDAFEGKEVEDLKEAKRVLSLLESHVRQLRRQFGLSVEDEGRHVTEPETRFEVPAEFQGQLGGLWQAYLGLHEALAGDDFQSSIGATDAAEKALGAVDSPYGELGHDAHMAWMKMLPELKSALDGMKEAGDIEGVRQHFEALSQALWVALGTFGKQPAGAVYRLHCPMAAEGQGADWLQGDQDIRNPYFGASMPKCGSVVDTLPAEPAGETGGPGHEGGEHK